MSTPFVDSCSVCFKTSRLAEIKWAGGHFLRTLEKKETAVFLPKVDAYCLLSCFSVPGSYPEFYRCERSSEVLTATETTHEKVSTVSAAVISLICHSSALLLVSRRAALLAHSYKLTVRSPGKQILIVSDPLVSP